jgi:anti-anti-sigma factor
MEFRTTDLGDVARVSLVGRLDTHGVGLIETRFTATVVPPGRPTALDLSEVSFVSSMGLRLLIGTARALAMRGARLVAYGAQPLVSEALEVAGLGDMVPILADEPQALALLRS